MSTEIRWYRKRLAQGLVTAAGCVLAFGLHIAGAGGTFDGKWEGQANGLSPSSNQAAAQCVATATATVESNAVKGTLAFPHSNVAFGGTIAPDGSFKTPTGFLTGKFESGLFSGNFSIASIANHCGAFRMTMKRA